jgi:hypothetical protein
VGDANQRCAVATSLAASGRIERRALLQAGAIGLAGLGLPELLAGQALARSKNIPRKAGFGRARSCMLIWLKGGPSHLDTFDPKPDAPAEIRGQFSSIATRVPGIFFSEHVPCLAAQADKLTVVRSLTHRDNGHPSAAYEMTTGHAYPRAMNLADVSTRDDHPHLGSSVAAISGRTCPVPSFVLVPDYLIVNGQFRSGQNAGFLGRRCDPLVPGGDPSAAAFRPADLGLGASVEVARLRGRRTLLNDLAARAPRGPDARPPADLFQEMDSYRKKAFSLLETGQVRRAFELQAEPRAIRERYGMNFFGQSVLLGRRLLEAGVRLVHVNCMSSIYGGERNWDTHKDNFNLLSQTLLPRTDRAIAELLADLSASGLLDETLIVVTGEFGRTPKINANAGRDHWPQAFSVLVAGAGLAGGRTFGSTDKHGAAPADRPVTSAELAATIFHSLGIEADTQLTIQNGRPWRISEAKAAVDLWG